MNDLIAFYQKRLNLQNVTFVRIDYDDAMVAIVYKIIDAAEVPFILKICTKQSHYFREIYFLQYFARRISVPRIIQTVPPQKNYYGT